MFLLALVLNVILVFFVVFYEDVDEIEKTRRPSAKVFLVGVVQKG